MLLFIKGKMLTVTASLLKYDTKGLMVQTIKCHKADMTTAEIAAHAFDNGTKAPFVA
jgi:hypothetical protein